MSPRAPPARTRRLVANAGQDAVDVQSGRIPRLHAAAPPVVAFSLASAAALLPHLKCGVAAHAMPPTHQREATSVSLNTERK